MRREQLVNGVDERLKEIIRQVAQEFQATVIELESMPDHDHLLCEVDPQFGIHCLVRTLKGRVNRISFGKSSPGFVATAGGAPLAGIQQYIEDQKNVAHQLCCAPASAAEPEPPAKCVMCSLET